MSHENKDRYFRTRDENGEEILCPVESVANPEAVSENEMEECVDAATAGRYAGTITVEN
jgi:hypothetical protein